MSTFIQSQLAKHVAVITRRMSTDAPSKIDGEIAWRVAALPALKGNPVAVEGMKAEIARLEHRRDTRPTRAKGLTDKERAELATIHSALTKTLDLMSGSSLYSKVAEGKPETPTPKKKAGK